MTESREDLAGVMRRVAKLLAIAEDDRANPAEAAAAASMAEKIMRKYQIDNADVIEASLKRGGAEVFGTSDLGSTLDPTRGSKESSIWAGPLAVGVANLSDCQVRYVRTAEFGKTLRFQGFAADAQMAKFTYLYLVSQMIGATAKYKRETYDPDLPGFRAGFVSAVVQLINAAIVEKRRQMSETVSSRSLVIVKAGAVAEHFGAVEYGARKATRHRGGYHDGHAAGSKVDVGRRAVGHSGNSAARIAL